MDDGDIPAQLSPGDALVVIALLLFAAGWVAGGIYIIRTSADPGGGLILLGLLLAPPAWAMWTIADLLHRRSR